MQTIMRFDNKFKLQYYERFKIDIFVNDWIKGTGVHKTTGFNHYHYDLYLQNAVQ